MGRAEISPLDEVVIYLRGNEHTSEKRGNGYYRLYRLMSPHEQSMETYQVLFCSWGPLFYSYSQMTTYFSEIGERSSG
jgi:hypothetical protein